MVQILPQVPNFGSQLAQVLGIAGKNIGEGLVQTYGNVKEKNIMEQLQDPNLSAMQKISLIGKLPKEKGAVMATMYAPLLKEEVKSSALQNILGGDQVPNQPIGGQNLPSAPENQVLGQQEISTNAPTNITQDVWKNLSPEKRMQLSVRFPQLASQMETQSYHQEKAGQVKRAEVNESWKEHQKYIDDQEDKYREGKNTLDKLKIQKDLVSTGKLVSPTVAALSEAFGIDPLLYNDTSQLYSKIQSDLAGGVTKWLGTARLAVPEFNTFLKKFATLKNSDAGKNLILDFLMTEQRLKNAEAQITQDLTDQYTRSGLPLPHNFRSVVNKMVDKEYDKGGLELKNLMQRANKISPTKSSSTQSFILNGIPYDIPKDRINEFLKENPEAKKQ